MDKLRWGTFRLASFGYFFIGSAAYFAAFEKGKSEAYLGLCFAVAGLIGFLFSFLEPKR